MDVRVKADRSEDSESLADDLTGTSSQKSVLQCSHLEKLANRSAVRPSSLPPVSRNRGADLADKKLHHLFSSLRVEGLPNFSRPILNEYVPLDFYFGPPNCLFFCG